MEEEREEGGISIGEIFRVIFSRKWLVLIITAVIAVAGTLGIYFGMNNSKREYVASFVLNLPGDDKTQIVYTYPDGTQFYYSDLVSAEILKEVKASDSAFDDIQVEAMANEGNISIVRTENQQKTEVVYTINVKANYFKNKEVARRFITKLANVPGSHLAEMNISYDLYIDRAKSAIDYETEINNLLNQVNYIVKQYNTLISSVGDVAVENGKTLSYYKQGLTAYVDEQKVLSNLLTEVQDKNYLKSEELIEKYKRDLTQLRKDLTKAEATLKNLLTLPDASGSNATVVKQQSDLVEDLKQKIKQLEIYTGTYKYEEGDEQGGEIREPVIGDAVPQEFTVALNQAYSTVEAFTAEYKDISSKVYGTSSMASFATSNVITTEGETGLIISFAISLVAGLIIAMIVGYIVGRVKLNKKSAKAAPATESTGEPAEAEVLAQVAATDAEEDKKNKK